MTHALVVDDAPESAQQAADWIAAEGFSVATACTLRAARQQIALHTPSLVLLNLTLPDGKGMDLMDEVNALPKTTVVLTAAHASLEASVQALRRGAADYLVKPLTQKQLQDTLLRLDPAALPVGNAPGATAEQFKHMLETHGHFGSLWGRSASMRMIHEQIMRVATTAINVFITGESGSGKELVARTVHDLSPRHANAFLAVNCGAIAPNLIESEIFGHEKGSFTGADRQHKGFFERANGGTLFLDEVTEMPVELQIKLLRVLETGTYMRVGSTQLQHTDVRIVAASNRDPMDAVANGRLREDLLYRLNVFPIHLPALRERLEDVGLLATHFLEEISRSEGSRKRFSKEALARLAAYRWPGNVRELRNAVQRAYVMAREDVIEVDCLFQATPQMTTFVGGVPDAPVLKITLGTPLCDIERQVTLATLEHFGQHKERTAAALGVSLKTLYNRLKEYSVMPVRMEGKAGVAKFGRLH